jgi:hypothetical protein
MHCCQLSIELTQNVTALRLNAAFHRTVPSLLRSTSSLNGEIKINKPCLSRQIYLCESQVPCCELLRGVPEILPTEMGKLMHASIVELFPSAASLSASLHVCLGRSHYNAVWICVGQVCLIVMQFIRDDNILRSVHIFWILISALVNET